MLAKPQPHSEWPKFNKLNAIRFNSACWAILHALLSSADCKEKHYNVKQLGSTSDLTIWVQTICKRLSAVGKKRGKLKET